jgi:hypothetical protein
MKRYNLQLLPPLLLLLAVALHVAAVRAAENARTVGNARPTHWERGPRAAPELLLTLRVALTPHKRDGQLGELVAAMADPASPLFEQLENHFSPSEASAPASCRWCRTPQYCGPTR